MKQIIIIILLRDVSLGTGDTIHQPGNSGSISSIKSINTLSNSWPLVAWMHYIDRLHIWVLDVISWSFVIPPPREEVGLPGLIWPAHRGYFKARVAMTQTSSACTKPMPARHIWIGWSPQPQPNLSRTRLFICHTHMDAIIHPGCETKN